MSDAELEAQLVVIQIRAEQAARNRKPRAAIASHDSASQISGDDTETTQEKYLPTAEGLFDNVAAIMGPLASDLTTFPRTSDYDTQSPPEYTSITANSNLSLDSLEGPELHSRVLANLHNDTTDGATSIRPMIVSILSAKRHHPKIFYADPIGSGRDHAVSLAFISECQHQYESCRVPDKRKAELRTTTGVFQPTYLVIHATYEDLQIAYGISARLCKGTHVTVGTLYDGAGIHGYIKTNGEGVDILHATLSAVLYALAVDLISLCGTQYIVVHSSDSIVQQTGAILQKVLAHSSLRSAYKLAFLLGKPLESRGFWTMSHACESGPGRAEGLGLGRRRLVVPWHRHGFDDLMKLGVHAGYFRAVCFKACTRHTTE